jgi:sulfide:quinone oxidoreductase
MMQFTQLDALTYVGKQISVANLNDLKRMNVKTVIVARPEGETADQPAISELRDAAEALGITVHQIPVVPGNISDADVFAFRAITSEAGHPVFAYCHSGMRATSLWALSAVEQGQSPDKILRMAHAAGFDLTAVAARLATNAA